MEWIVTGTSMPVEADTIEQAVDRAQDKSGWHWEATPVAVESRRCLHCERPLHNEPDPSGQPCWVDDTGGDVCGWGGGNEPHEPAPIEVAAHAPGVAPLIRAASHNPPPLDYGPGPVDTWVIVTFAAGRRGAGSIDCLVCGDRIHQREDRANAPWFDGDGSAVGLGDFGSHTHIPAYEMGPVFGPFEYADVTYDTLRVDEGETLAVFDRRRGDWILTDFAGPSHAGQAYSDITIAPTAKTR